MSGLIGYIAALVDDLSVIAIKVADESLDDIVFYLRDEKANSKFCQIISKVLILGIPKS